MRVSVYVCAIYSQSSFLGGNRRGLLKSFNMKQSSESRVCVLYVTRDCVMLFNPHEYKVFQTERNAVWKWFKRVGGVRWSEGVGWGVEGWACILQLTRPGEAKGNKPLQRFGDAMTNAK